MAAALKVLDDHLQMKSTPRPGAAVPQELRNAFSIAQLEWFKVTTSRPVPSRRRGQLRE